MKRRKLVDLLPAASALLALRSNGAPIPPPVRFGAGFVIAIQCWSFKEFTLFDSITMAAAAGAHVELFPGQKIGGPLGDLKFGPDLKDEHLQLVIGHLHQHQVGAVNYGVANIPKQEAAARKIFELAKKLGMYGVTTESLDHLDLLESLAEEYDVRVCLHNHPKPTALWNPETIWKAVEGRHSHIGFCADIGHWASSGLDPMEVIRAVAPRVRSFHMKDRESLRTWSHDRPFGTGAIDLVGMLDEVGKHGFSGNVTIEYEHNWNTNLPEVAQCVGFLRAYGAMRT